jgi:hypothetical protein
VLVAGLIFFIFAFLLGAAEGLLIDLVCFFFVPIPVPEPMNRANEPIPHNHGGENNGQHAGNHKDHSTKNYLYK